MFVKLKYAYSIFWRQPVISLILCVQIVLCFVLSNEMISLTELQNLSTKMISAFDQYDYLYYQDYAYNNEIDEELISSLSGCESIGSIYQTGFIMDRINNGAEVFAYSDIFGKMGKEKNQKWAEWYNDNPDDDRLNVVIYDRYKRVRKGDIIECLNKDNTKKFKICVSGVLDRSDIFPFFTKGGDRISPSDLFFTSNYYNKFDDSVFLLCSKEQLDRMNIETEFIQRSHFLFFSDSTDPSEMDSNADILNQNGLAVSKTELQETGKKNFLEYLEISLPQNIFLLLVSVIGMISILLLDILKQQKLLAVYRLCGCNEKQSIVIYFIYFVSILFLAVCISITYISLNSADKVYMALTFVSVLFMIVLALILLTVSLFFLRVNLKKISIKQTLFQ